MAFGKGADGYNTPSLPPSCQRDGTQIPGHQYTPLPGWLHVFDINSRCQKAFITHMPGTYIHLVHGGLDELDLFVLNTTFGYAILRFELHFERIATKSFRAISLSPPPPPPPPYPVEVSRRFSLTFFGRTFQTIISYY